MIEIEPIPEPRTTTRDPHSPGTPWARRRVLRAINENIERLHEPYRWLPETLKPELLAHEAKITKWASNRLLRDWTGRICTDEEKQPLTLQTVRHKHAEQRTAEKKHLVHGLIKHMYESGQIGIAIHQTLPGRYHFQQQRGRRTLNLTIWDLYRILNHRFRNAYKALKKLCGIRLDFVISPEPHEDGTPHLHWVLFVPTEHLAESLRILKRCLIDTNEPYHNRQARIEPIHAAAAATSYVTKAIAYLAKNGDERAEPYREWRQWNGMRAIRFGGMLRICEHRECRRLGETPRQAPDIDYDPDQYADPDDAPPGQPATAQDTEGNTVEEITQDEINEHQREELAKAMNELAAASHADDYWQWLKLQGKYELHRIPGMPHCVTLKINDEPNNPEWYTRHNVAIVPGGWARIRRIPEGWRPKILAKITRINEEKAELAEAVQDTMRQLVLNSQEALRAARIKQQNGPPPPTQGRLFG